jgi:hypothetical protein
MLPIFRALASTSIAFNKYRPSIKYRLKPAPAKISGNNEHRRGEPDHPGGN